eukprot:549579-Amphidinium_carterae.1
MVGEFPVKDNAQTLDEFPLENKENKSHTVDKFSDEFVGKDKAYIVDELPSKETAHTEDSAFASWPSLDQLANSKARATRRRLISDPDCLGTTHSGEA